MLVAFKAAVVVGDQGNTVLQNLDERCPEPQTAGPRICVPLLPTH